MRSLFYVLLALFVAGLAINYNSKYSTEVFVMRTFFNTMVLKNKWMGMEEGDPTTGLGITSPAWKQLSLEAQTLYNVMRWERSRNKITTGEGMRQAMRSALAPPVSAFNSLEFSTLSSLGDSLLVKLRDNFYVNHYFGKNKNGKAIMMLHGGGGFAGEATGFQVRSLVEHMTHRFNSTILNILSVNYRLIGLNEDEKKDKKSFATKFSEQIDDAVEAYKWLLKSFKAEDIVLMGDSFGGTMATGLLHRLATETDLPMPGAAILMSGVYDLTAKLSSQHMNEKNTLMCSQDLLDIMSVLYKADTEQSPLITWKNAKTDKLFSTKLLVVYSKDEEFTAESLAFLNLLKEKNHPSVTVIADEMMPHIYPYLGYYFPEAKITMDRVLDFVDQY